MEEARNRMASTIVNDVKNTLRQFEERMLKLGEKITNNTTGMFQKGNLIQTPLPSQPTHSSTNTESGSHKGLTTGNQ